MANDDNASRRTSRRAALETLGIGVLTATAGCLFGGDDEAGSPTAGEAARRSDSPSGGDRETTAATATHEQSIITDTPAIAGTPATGTPEGPTRTSSGSGPETVEASATSGPTTRGSEPATSAEPTTTETTATVPGTAPPTPSPTTEPTRTPTATPERAGGEWTEETPLPVVGSDAGGGVLGGKLHFFGGIETATGLDAVARAFAYDPTAGAGGSWERLPALPRALWGPCGVATDDALYSFGGAPRNAPYADGESPTDVVFRYRPDDGWTDLTETEGVRCPYPNWVMGGVYNPVDGLIYCVGGGTGAHDAPTATDHGLDGERPGTFDERRLWTFDPAAERVAEADLARLPEAKRWPTVALFDIEGKRYLHAIGGLLGTTGPTDSNVRYDIEAADWERMEPTPRPGTYATHSDPVIDGRAYLTHGMFWEVNPPSSGTGRSLTATTPWPTASPRTCRSRPTSGAGRCRA